MAIKKIICYMMLLFTASYYINIIAQTTSYYALIKIDNHGSVDSKCKGGQFVKITKNICFDTDANGNDVGNGKLYREVSNSSSNHTYSGDSFHGKARYIFSEDYSTLTVEINPHFKYHYKKACAPSGVLTCSLVKKNNEGSAAVPYDVNNGITWNNFQVNNGSPINNNSYPNNSNRSSNAQPARKFKCAYCNGTGRIERNDNAPASFGQTRANKKCNECGKIYDPTVFNHYHVQCGHCGGTGNAK